LTVLKTVVYPSGNTKSSDVFTLFADDAETVADHFVVFCSWRKMIRVTAGAGQGRATSRRRSRTQYSCIN